MAIESERNKQPITDVAPAAEDRIQYFLSFGGLSLSDSADGPQSAISWNEVDESKFLHVGVFALVPASLTTLAGKFRKLPASGVGNPADDRDLRPAKPVADQRFEFIIDHFTLESNTRYLIRVADAFTDDVKCAATFTIRTKA